MNIEIKWEIHANEKWIAKLILSVENVTVWYNLTIHNSQIHKYSICYLFNHAHNFISYIYVWVCEMVPVRG